MRIWTRGLPTLLATMGALLSVAACIDNIDPQEEAVRDAISYACDHFAEAPRAVTTVPTSTDELPLVTNYDRNSIILTAVEGGHGGYVRMHSPGEEMLFLLSRSIELRLYNIVGVEYPLSTVTVEPDSCANAAVAYSFDLKFGAHVIKFVPSVENTVDLVIMEAVIKDIPHDH